jgi:hypothetical protein
MTPKEHANLLSILMWIFAGLQLMVVAALGVVYLAFAGVIAAALNDAPHRPGSAPPPPPEVIIGFVFVIMVIALVVTVAFMIPKIVAGYGLRHGKSWAKVWTIIACVLAIMSFPIGTAIGAYGIWFVAGEEGRAFFDGPDFKTPMAGVPPPPPNSWQ